MKIAVAHFIHETVTFLCNDTARADFIYDGSPLSGEELLQSSFTGYIRGFVKAIREYDGMEVIGITSPMFPKTASGSGWITADAYEHFLRTMIEELSAKGPFDGVYLALHGAMAVRNIARPEADIARRIREAVGDRTVIAATFDPHGNEDDAFFEHAELAFCSKYYPHYDEYLQGTRAARTMVRTIRGDFEPVYAVCKVPLLTPTVVQWTGARPWSDLIQRALIWEARHPDVYVNVYFGFPWNDAADAGMTIQAISNKDVHIARRITLDLAEFAWLSRGDLANAAQVCSIGEGVKRAKQRVGGKPIVLADHSDRTGSATWLLAEILEQDVSGALIATVADRTLAARLEKRGVRPGDSVDMEVGGGVESSDGAPVRIRGTLLNMVRESLPALGGNSPWIVIGFGVSNVLVVTPYLAQITEPEALVEYLRLDPRSFRMIALKSRVHFRRGFMDGGLVDHALIVEPEHPFLGTTKLAALHYQHLTLEDYYPYGRDEFIPKVICGARRCD